MLIVKLDEAFTDTAMQKLLRDQLLDGANGGVLYLADFSKRHTWPVGGSAPVSGSSIGDLSDHAGAPFAIQSPNTVTLAGNGLDFTGVTKNNACINIPSSVFSAIWAAGAGSQYFLACFYLKLRNGTVGAAGPWPYVAGEDGSAPFFSIGQTTGNLIKFRRHTSYGVFEDMTIANQGGQFAQVSMWRNAGGQGARVKTASTSVSASAAVGSAASYNFSGERCQVGIGAQWLADLTGIEAWAYWKFYRGFIEDLVASGRNPVTVLDADWARVTAAGSFT